jgi:hypothetical protein
VVNNGIKHHHKPLNYKTSFYNSFFDPPGYKYHLKPHV